MKKLIAILLAAVMVLGAMTGCSDNAEPQATEAAAAPAEKPAETAASAEAPADDTVYTMYICYADNAGTIVDETAKLWAQWANEESNGRLKIEAYSDSTMGNPQDVLDMAIAGDWVISIGQGGYYADLGIREADATFAPYLFESWDDFDKLLNSDWYQSKLAALETDLGLKCIGLGWHYGVRNTISTKKITCLDDIEGMKIRLPGVSAQVVGYRVMGASPVTMGLTEVYTALSQGSIDGMENQLFGIYSGAFYEVAKYLTLTKHCYVDCSWVMNADNFNSLPADLQEILISTGEKATAYYNENIEAIEAEALQNLINAGCEVTEVDFEEFSQVTEKFFTAEEHADWDPNLYQTLRDYIENN